MKRLSQSIRDAWSVFRSGGLSAWARGDDTHPSGGAVLTSPYQESVWVYACVQALSQNLANVEFRISKGMRDGESIIESGPLFDLFEQPHPQVSRYEFWELLVDWLMLRGRAYVVGLDASGALVRLTGRLRREALPSRLVILNSECVRTVVVSGVLQGFRYQASNESPMQSQVFLPEEVLYLRLQNPYDWFGGMAPLQVAALAAQTDYASAQFMRGLMLNNADTGLIVSGDSWLNEDQRNQILSALRERKRKAGTADRPLLLGGGLRVEKPSVTTADMQFLENRKFSRQEICAVFGVPQEMIGFTEDANRSVSDSARLNFTEHRLVPLCRRLESSFQAVCRMFGEGLYGWFDVDALPVMQAARRSRVDVAIKLFSIGYPLNEINQQLDLGMPEVPWGDKGYLPFSLQEAGAEPEEPAAPPQDPSAPADQEPVQAPADPAADPQEDPVTEAWSKLGKLIAPTHQCVSPAKWEKSIRASVKAKKSKLQRFFFEQRGRVLAKLSTLSPQRSIDPVQKGIDDLMDSAEENAKLMARLKPLLLSDLGFGGAQLWSELSLPGDFQVPPDKAIQFLYQRENLLSGINQTTFDSLKGSLQEGLKSGETFDQLVQRVKSVYSVASDSRAETIALTETNVAINSGRYEGMVEAGVEKKAWLASNLENSRATHQQAGRDYSEGIPLDEDFIVGGEHLRFPGDPTGSPENTINCRCTSIALVGDKAMEPEHFLEFSSWMQKANV